jgi:hypothetical protein
MIATILIPLTHRIIALSIAAAVLATTVEMIRRRKLREEYAMLWLSTSMILTVLAIFPQIPFFLNQALGINYLTMLMLSCFLFLAMIVMHYATAISRDAEHIRQLAQQVALLKEEVERLRKQTQQASRNPDD